jgi:dihydrofolate reductase
MGGAYPAMSRRQLPSLTGRTLDNRRTAVRKVINSTYISLDGVIEGPHLWPPTEGSDPEGERIQTDLLLACDAVVMGRRTYDGFAPVWPTRSGDPYSDRINSMPKYVVSTTLTEPEWNNTTVIDRDPAAAIARLKEEPGKDIVQYGFGQLSHTMLAEGLLDELRLWVHPFVIGKGGPEDLLYRDAPTTTFRLVDSRQLENGIVVLSYTIAR